MIAHSVVLKNFHSLTVSKQNSKIWKDRAHSYFDLIWEHRKYTSRTNVYKGLALFLGTSKKKTHMSQFSNNQCKKVVKWSIDILNKGIEMEERFGEFIYPKIDYPDYLELNN